MTESEMTWPALRTTNRSPRPLSKMISAASRESRAAEERGARALAAGELVAALDVLARVLRLAGDEALVAAQHLAATPSARWVRSLVARSRGVLAQLARPGRRRAPAAQLERLLVGGAVHQHDVRPGLGARGRRSTLPGVGGVGDVVAVHSTPSIVTVPSWLGAASTRAAQVGSASKPWAMRRNPSARRDVADRPGAARRRRPRIGGAVRRASPSGSVGHERRSSLGRSRPAAATAATSIGFAVGRHRRAGRAKTMTATTARRRQQRGDQVAGGLAGSGSREDSALRAAVSSGVSGRPSSATTRGALRHQRAPSVRGGRVRAPAAGGVEAALRAEQPLLAAGGEGLAALPQRERLLEGRGALLEFGDHAHELVARLLEARATPRRGRLSVMTPS